MKKQRADKPTNKRQSNTVPPKTHTVNGAKFHLEFITPAQKVAWSMFQEHEVLFLTGPAGTGKSHLATAFAINEVLQNRKKKIVLTRPIVEAGESLGFLPGDLNEKVDPYMMPLYDCMKKLGGENNAQRDIINSSVEVAPLAYMRGRTFDDAICIFDEAQNATKAQLKLFLTRFGKNSKIIITGDPQQTDLKLDKGDDVPLTDVMRRLETLTGVGIMVFKRDSIVRHHLITDILDRLED
jgi:phosphate starvation-inducible PhoH-like protein